MAEATKTRVRPKAKPAEDAPAESKIVTPDRPRTRRKAETGEGSSVAENCFLLRRLTLYPLP